MPNGGNMKIRNIRCNSHAAPVNVLTLSVLLLIFMFLLSSGGNRETSGENRERRVNADIPELDSSQTVNSREEALELLRTIGMSVFTDDAVDAPEFTVMNLKGEEVSLSDFSGKVIFMNFWATWCGPCKIEMPTMDALYNDLRDEDFVILAVNQQEETDIVREFIDREGYSFPVLLDSDGLLSYQYGVRGIPTTYIIGTDGKVLAGKVGTHIYDGELYRSLFRQLM